MLGKSPPWPRVPSPRFHDGWIKSVFRIFGVEVIAGGAKVGCACTDLMHDKGVTAWAQAVHFGNDQYSSCGLAKINSSYRIAIWRFQGGLGHQVWSRLMGFAGPSSD